MLIFLAQLIRIFSKDELKSFAQQKPEYAKIFLIYNEIKILRNNVEIERLATPTTEKVTHFPNVPSVTQPASSSSVLLKRPLSDKNKNEIQIPSDKNLVVDHNSNTQNHPKLDDTKND